LLSLEGQEITVQGGKHGIIMAAEDGSHGNLLFGHRFRLEDEWQSFTPPIQLHIETLNSALQLCLLLGLQLILAAIDGIDLPKNPSGNTI